MVDHGLLNMWSNAACYWAYWSMRGGTNSWDHRCRSIFMVDSLVFHDTRDLWAIIVMMILIHLLLKLFDVFVRHNFTRTIAAHLFILCFGSLLVLVIIVPSSSTTSQCWSFRSISATISSPSWEEHWRLHVIKGRIIVRRRNQGWVTIETFQLEVRL